MGRIYLIRHGQTDSNAGRSFQGRIDNPLNELGLDQARQMAEYVKTLEIDAIYSSSMLRARQTAEVLAEKCGLVNQPMDLLQEISFGQWEGRSFARLWEESPKEMGIFMTTPADYTPPEGESLAQAQARCEKALAQILEKEGHDKNIAIVSHGGIIRLQLCSLLNCPLNSLWRFSVHNVSVSTISDWDGNLIADTLNDYHFLEGAINPKSTPSIV